MDGRTDGPTGGGMEWKKEHKKNQWSMGDTSNLCTVHSKESTLQLSGYVVCKHGKLKIGLSTWVLACLVNHYRRLDRYW